MGQLPFHWAEVAAAKERCLEGMKKKRAVHLRMFHHPNEIPPNDLLMTPVIIILVRDIIICGPSRNWIELLLGHAHRKLNPSWKKR